MSKNNDNSLNWTHNTADGLRVLLDVVKNLALDGTIVSTRHRLKITQQHDAMNSSQASTLVSEIIWVRWMVLHRPDTMKS